MNSEEERERAAVYMDGMAQMRSEWARAARKKKPRGDKSSRGTKNLEVRRKK
jgi:hypothetical protein